MSFAAKYLERAAFLINLYDGTMPLVHHLKNYFSQNKKHGSKDRKHISHLCYCYYRVGYSTNTLSIEERIKIALFLCNDNAGIWYSLFEGPWLDNWSTNLNKRIEFIHQQQNDFILQGIFPWQAELSNGIDGTAFSLSHLVQPDLFLRIRPTHEQNVVNRLRNYEIHFRKVSPTALALSNGTKLDDVLDINKELVVQDYSSQQIAEFLEAFKSNIIHHTSDIKVWDCCAASGGKSILAKDVLGNVKLTVSDIRESIISNLKQRLAVAGINIHQSLVVDISSNAKTFNQSFDLVIADVPCTGSGTWSRTPEQMNFFQTQTIDEYAAKQKSIVSNVIPSLKPNGYLLYITCSVFKKENEEVVDFIKEKFQLELVMQEILIGYDKRADTMFGALLRKMATA
jgi:16S rRNA (cytosine967-C5)-methyltransferase